MKTGYKVCDAMTKKPVVVSPDDSLESAAKLMADHHVGALVILDGKEIKGIVTEQDIVRNVIAKGIDPKKIDQIFMTKILPTTPFMDVVDDEGKRNQVWKFSGR